MPRLRFNLIVTGCPRRCVWMRLTSSSPSATTTASGRVPSGPVPSPTPAASRPTKPRHSASPIARNVAVGVRQGAQLADGHRDQPQHGQAQLDRRRLLVAAEREQHHPVPRQANPAPVGDQLDRREGPAEESEHVGEAGHRRQRRQLQAQAIERARLDHVEPPHEREHEQPCQRRRDRQRHVPAALVNRTGRQQERRQQSRQQHRDRPRLEQGRAARGERPSRPGEKAGPCGLEPRRHVTEAVQCARERQRDEAGFQPKRRPGADERDRGQQSQERESPLGPHEPLRVDAPGEHRPPDEEREAHRDNHRREPHPPRIKLAAPEQADEGGDHDREREQGRQLEQPRPDPAYGVDRV